MPPGAKKRKALKKKQQRQEPIGNTKISNGGDNRHGHDEHGSKDDRESDDSNLSSPGSQGNEDPSSLVKDTAKEISDATQGLVPKNGNAIAVDNNKIVDKLLNPSSENCTEIAKNIASQDSSVKDYASVSKVMIPEKSEHAQTSSTHSNLVNKKSDDKKEYHSLEKNNGKVATFPGSAAGTSRKVENVRESEVPVSSEKKPLLLPGPPAVRTSWLSCCGLFDAMTGSDR